MRIGFTLNGGEVAVDALPMARLLDVLREDLRVTGTKEGCGEGECGACTVLIDGRAVNACLVPVVQVQGAAVTTVEGLAAPEGRLHPVQAAFLTHGGAQCGICTPGFLVAAAELLAHTPRPTRPQVREALAGNLCRCTGYQKIVDAVVEALATEAGGMITSHAPVHCPADLAEALALRAAHPEAMPLAGGTDVMVFVESGTLSPPAFLNLWGLAELRGVQADGDGLRLGALCTYTELEADARVQATAPALVEAARTVGAKQIQNRGTLAGNVANASPAGDSLPVLLALDAEVEVASVRGTRRVPMDALYTGYRKLALAPDELITAICLPARHPADVQYYRKVGTRLAQAISKVMLGGRLRIEGGVVTEARVAFGSVAAFPVRARTVEAALVGRPVDAAAADLVGADIKPIDDIRSTATYRLEVARRILQGWLAAVAAEGASSSR